MTDQYDARKLEEPLSRVKKLTWFACVAAVVAALVGLWFDRYQPALCRDTHCFQRSGAVIVMLGTYLAFMSGAVIIKSIQFGDQKPIERTNERASRYYGRAAFWVLIAGTLIWGFGDFIAPTTD